MGCLKFPSTLVLVLIIIINLRTCSGASLVAIGNNTDENTAMAKTSNEVMDVFEDIRWFFERLTIFCDIVERMLPPERKEREQPQTSVGLTLQRGFRHFIFGTREISRSIVRVVSDKDVREYKQLSRATDFAHDMIKSVGEFFRNLRMLIANLFATYTFYIPEVLVTKCMGNYLLHKYPHKHLYEYPILLINDIINSFRKTEGFDSDTSVSSRTYASGSEVHFDKNMEQNEILDEDLYVFHNTPVSPTPELEIQNQETTSKNDSESLTVNVDTDLDDPFGLKDKLEVSVTGEAPSWKRCVQMYATESIFRKLEFYFFLKNKQ